MVIREKTLQDLYLAGGTVTVNAPVLGDLVAAGGTINVNDTIKQDVLAAGGNLFLNGYMGDDVRCAGGSIRITENVAGDLIVAGGTVEVARGTVIGGNLLVTGGQVTVDGDVDGLVRSAAGKFTLNGTAKGDVDCRGGEVVINGTVEGPSVLAAQTIRLGATAKFNSNVRYWNEDGELDFGNTLNAAQATFDESLAPQTGKWQYLGFASFLMVLWYLGMALVTIFLLQYLFSATMKKAADTVRNAAVRSLGFGFLFLVAVPVAIVIAIVTLIGLPIGLLGLVLYITILLLATAIVAVVAANWINNTYHHGWTRGRIVWTAFGVFVLLKLLSLAPFAGPLIMLLLVCQAFGGILQNIRWKQAEQPAT